MNGKNKTILSVALAWAFGATIGYLAGNPKAREETALKAKSIANKVKSKIHRDGD